MTDDELLALIRATPWIADLLTEFDFDLARVEDGPVEPVHLPGGEALTMVAGDAAGGAYLLVGTGPTYPVVYAGSEGEGGLIATSLADALALVVGLPSIHDAVILAPDDPDGVQLRAMLARADDEIREDWPELDADRVRLRDALGLAAGLDLLGALHTAAADERYRPISDAGDVYEPMLA